MGRRQVRRVLAFAAALPLVLAAPPAAFAQDEQQVVGVRVHVDADPEVTLLQETPTAWARVCQAPCDAVLPAGVRYRVIGGASSMSDPFLLSGLPGSREVIVVDTSGQTRRVVGVVSVVASSILFLGGIALAVAGLASDPGQPALVLTGIGVAVGVAPAALITGIVLIARGAGGKDQVEQELENDRSASLKAPAWADGASWRGAAPEAMRTPSAVGVPLVSGTF
jgi:hypothetical protein